jgi:hypothetical protein
MLTRQEIFETVSRHLFEQGKPSMSIFGSGEKLCAYRGEGGVKCAAGVLIPDNRYSFRMEQNAIGNFSDETFARYFPEVELTDRDLLTALQDVHDTLATDEENEPVAHFHEDALRRRLMVVGERDMLNIDFLAELRIAAP